MSGLFIPNVHTGGYLSYQTYLCHIKGASCTTLHKEITPHKLRHTHASLLAETMTPEQISRRLGHHDDEITKKIYIHVTQRMKDKDNADVDSISFIS